MLRLALGASLMMLGGCADYGGLAMDVDGAPPEGTRADPDGLELEAGIALRLHVRPRSRTSVLYEDPDAFELVAVDREIVEAFRDLEEPWRWVIVARLPGRTCLEVEIDGSVEDCLDVVVRQGAP